MTLKGSLSDRTRSLRAATLFSFSLGRVPGQHSGKPCIRGLRITVQDILEYLAEGMKEEKILQDFPELTREDIKACLGFAADRERRLFVAPG
jgi:uncharacterized protein (DUF433 family)